MAENFDINVYQKAIEAIISNGFVVLQIFPFEGSTAYYYLVHQFNPSMRTPTDDIQFNQVVGVNITDFIKNNAYIGDRHEFIRKFMLLINNEETKITRVEFPNSMRWFKFAFVK